MNFSPALLRATVYGGGLVLWEWLVRNAQNPARYPSPSGVFASFKERVASGELPTAVEQSLSRILIAFVIAAVVGVAIGVAMGRLPWIGRALSPIVNALRSIAPIALIPMAVLWFGVTGSAAIFIVVYAAIFPVILNATQAAQNIDTRLLNAARTLGANRWTILRRVVLRSSAPAIITGARIAMGFAWASIVAAELAMGIKLEAGGKVEAGLGQLMVSTLYLDRDVNALVLYMLVIGVIGLTIDRGLRFAYRRAAPWEFA